MTTYQDDKSIRPIWGAGGLLVLLAFITVSVLSVLFDQSLHLTSFQGFAVSSVYLASWIILTYPIRRNGGFREYWRRNVIAFERVHAWDGKAHSVRIQYRGARLSSARDEGAYALRMPLGGWFARPHLRKVDSQRPRVPWKRLFKVQQYPFPDGTSMVAVRDRQGNRAVMTVQMAVRLAAEEGAENLGYLLKIFASETWRRQEANAQLFQQVLCSESLSRAAIREVQNLVERIAATKRYKPHSKEAAAIHRDGALALDVLLKRQDQLNEPAA